MLLNPSQSLKSQEFLNSSRATINEDYEDDNEDLVKVVKSVESRMLQ